MENNVIINLNGKTYKSIDTQYTGCDGCAFKDNHINCFALCADIEDIFEPLGVQNIQFKDVTNNGNT